MNKPAWSMKPTGSRCGLGAFWCLSGCFRQARRCLFLSTSRSALSRATFRWSMGRTISSAMAGCGTYDFLHGARGLRLLDGVFRRERRCDGVAGTRLLPDCGLQQCRPQLGLQLLDGLGPWVTERRGALEGVFRHEQCCGGRRGAGSRTPGS